MWKNWASVSVQDVATGDWRVIFRSQGIALATAGRVNSSDVRGIQPGMIGGIFMQWTAPAFEEVCLNCEINSYVSAKL